MRVGVLVAGAMKEFLFVVGIAFASFFAFTFISYCIGIDLKYGFIAWLIVHTGYYIIFKKGCNKVISYYTKAILLNPGDAEAYYNKGTAYHICYLYYAGIKGNCKAIADYESVLRIDPNHLDARNALENIKKMNKSLYVLIGLFVAQSVVPLIVLLAANIMWIYTDDYIFIIIFSIGLLMIVIMLAMICILAVIFYAQKKCYDKTISDYTEAIRLNPNDAKAYINRGNAYSYWDYAGIKGGNKAIADYESALRIDPNHSDARNFLENVKKRVKMAKGFYVLCAASVALAIALFIGGYNPYYGEEEYLKRLEQR